MIKYCSIAILVTGVIIFLIVAIASSNIWYGVGMTVGIIVGVALLYIPYIVFWMMVHWGAKKGMDRYLNKSKSEMRNKLSAPRERHQS